MNYFGHLIILVIIKFKNCEKVEKKLLILDVPPNLDQLLITDFFLFKVLNSHLTKFIIIFCCWISNNLCIFKYVILLKEAKLACQKLTYYNIYIQNI